MNLRLLRVVGCDRDSLARQRRVPQTLKACLQLDQPASHKAAVTARVALKNFLGIDVNDLSRCLQYNCSRLTDDGIQANLCRQELCSLPPLRGHAMLDRRLEPMHCCEAWETASGSLRGLQAAEVLCDHARRTHCLNVVHICAVHDAITRFVGDCSTPQQVHAAIVRLLAAVHPDGRAARLTASLEDRDVAHRATRVRTQLWNTLQQIKVVVDHPAYEHLSCCPQLHDYGTFSKSAGIVLAALTGVSVGLLWWSASLLKMFTALLIGWSIREVGLFIEEIQHNRAHPDSGLRAYFLHRKFNPPAPVHVCGG